MAIGFFVEYSPTTDKDRTETAQEISEYVKDQHWLHNRLIWLRRFLAEEEAKLKDAEAKWDYNRCSFYRAKINEAKQKIKAYKPDLERYEKRYKEGEAKRAEMPKKFYYSFKKEDAFKERVQGDIKVLDDFIEKLEKLPAKTGNFLTRLLGVPTETKIAAAKALKTVLNGTGSIDKVIEAHKKALLQEGELNELYSRVWYTSNSISYFSKQDESELPASYLTQPCPYEIDISDDEDNIDISIDEGPVNNILSM
ncbi:MAG: hypothetical protein K2Q14_05955 [Gammaproteobacteria bacterium]|nr:hypothetical protein [Gammaproteobacteria bacterium]